jgi:uncharacterized protein YbaA (DUF1428 family)
MSYIEGFVAPVKTADKDKYLAFATQTAALFKQWGAIRVIESWGDDVPAGETTDFHRSVAKNDDETVVFSFIEYPDKATRDAANVKMMNDPAMLALGEMPFDGKRMIYGGFSVILDR